MLRGEITLKAYVLALSVFSFPFIDMYISFIVWLFLNQETEK